MRVVKGLAGELWRRVLPAGFSAAVPAVRGVRYDDAPRRRGVRPRADVYLPDGPGPHPSVAIVHGGAFVVGSKEMRAVRLLATRLVQEGYAVAACDYRLVFRGGRLDEARADVAAFLAWWHGVAGRFGLDPDRRYAIGLSAGATLLLLALEEAPAPPPAQVASFFGLYDLDHLTGLMRGRLRRLLLAEDTAAHRAARSPVSVYRAPKPLLLFHGTDDALIPVEQAHRFAAARRDAGLDTELIVYPGAPHGFLNNTRSPHTRDALTAIVERFRAPATVSAAP